MKKVFVLLATMSLLMISIPVNGAKHNVKFNDKKLSKKERRMKRRSAREERIDFKEERLRLISEWKERRRAQVQQEGYEGKYADLYMLPAWPVDAWFFEQKNLVNFSFHYKHADQGFAPKGGRKRLAELVFGSEQAKLEDILLVSRLLNNGLINPRSHSHEEDRYLYYLADTILTFDAAIEEWQAAIDYVRYARSGDWAFGVHIPLVTKRNLLGIAFQLPNNVLDKMTKTTETGGTHFRQKYGGSFDRFFEDVLSKKGITYSRGRSSFGFGDIELFSSVQYYSSSWERLVTGIKITFPTGKEHSSEQLWAPDRGNGGFYEVSFFGSGLIGFDYKINPHIFLQATWSSASTVKRRVPKLKCYNGVESDTPIIDLVFFGDRVEYKPGTAFCLPDSTIREFADNAVNVKLKKGFKVWLRIGNIFERFIFRRGFLDVFYDVILKTSDEVIGKVTKDIYDIRTLEVDTAQIENHIGADFSYQIDCHSRFRAGLKYLFAGRNVPEMFQAMISFNVDF
jgi:hypothetical protein